jgi:hypothetical protein
LGHDDDADERFSEFISVTDKIMQFDVFDWQDKIESLATESYALLLNWKKSA